MTYMIRLMKLLNIFIRQFLGLSQSLLIGIKFRLTHKDYINLSMIIIINFRLFSKKTLDYIEMLILHG